MSTSLLLSLDERISKLARETQSASQIVRLRRNFLLHENIGLAAVILDLLTTVLNDFFLVVAFDSCCDTNPYFLAVLPETKRVTQMLEIYGTCCALDGILAEELGRQGAHPQVMRLIQYSSTNDKDNNNNHIISEANQDVIMELQDMACRIAASYGGTFPMCVAPFSMDELQQRLPLVFHITPIFNLDVAKEDHGAAPNRTVEVKVDHHNTHSHNSLQNSNSNSNSSTTTSTTTESIWIHQVTKRQSAQEDVGFVMWPSAVVLAHWIASNPQILHHAERVLEIGAGCGLAGLLAARLLQKHKQQRQQPNNLEASSPLAPLPSLTSMKTDEPEKEEEPMVILSDFNPAVLENLNRNIALNDLEDVCTSKGLDFYQQPNKNAASKTVGWIDMHGRPHKPADLVLGADMICQPTDAVAAAQTISNALRPGGMAWIVCATAAHRFGVDIFPEECKRVGLSMVQTQTVGSIGQGALLQNIDPQMDQTAGYVDGMELTMFHIEKLVQ